MNEYSEVALRVDAVTKSFAGVRVVDGVSFEARRGEVLGLVGPNGAGKTTLLRMIVDILRPDEGSILIFGQKAGPQTQDRIGYLPEERGLYQRETVGKALKFLARLKGLSSEQIRGLVRTHLRKIGLATEWDQRVQKLSKGQQQKVQFAGAIIADPDVVLLDEPFSGLDPLNQTMVAQTVRELASAGKAVVLSTHEMSRVESLCDRIVMIHRGRIVLSGELTAVRREHARASLLVEASADLERLPGVLSVEPKNGCWRVELVPGVTRQEFLASLVASGADVIRFEQEIPSVEEIFVRTVRETV